MGLIARIARAGLLLLLAAPVPAATPATRPRPLQGLRTWAVYYGNAPEMATRLARFDLVVVDPGKHPPLEEVKRHGSLVLAYVSLGEVNVHHPTYPGIADEPWVHAPNPNWPEARILDVRAPGYERWLLDRVVPAALAGPVNGLFLDTADTALELERARPAAFGGSAEALGRVLRALRARYPRVLLVINGGLPLAERLPEVLDAVAVESVWTDYDFSTRTYRPREASDARARALRLERVAERGLPVLTLEYAAPGEDAWARRLVELARTHGFVPYVSTIDLAGLSTASLGP